MDTDRIRLLVASKKPNEVAKAAGVSRRTVYRFRGGAINLTHENMLKLEAWSKGRRLSKEQK